jgi:hypothetical protein
MEVGKLEDVPDDSPAVYSGCAIHDPDGADDLRVGRDSIPLCSIFLLVEGKLTVECILDSGCQIVVMNSVIWEKLSNNLQVERALKMEATNSTITETHGRLRNIRFTFDDIDIYLQVQVMPNAPYDILLGRPFYALTEYITRTSLMVISTLLSRIPTHSNVSQYRPKNGKDTGAQTQILVVERSDNRQDYTIHPYFVLGAAFPP